MNLLQPRFDLACFLVSRNRYRGGEAVRLQHYITKKQNLYQPLCGSYRDVENHQVKKYKRLLGVYPKPDKKECHKRPLQISRELTVERPWDLAANRYGIINEPFIEKRGAKGAYWRQLPRYCQLSRKVPVKNNFKFYDLSDPYKSPTHPANRHKGIFLANLRNNRATSRSMISNLVTCYHDPEAPGASEYYSHMHEMSYGKWPVKNEKANPHLFLRQSTVPQKMNSLYPKHIHFDPAPGRYENRYRFIGGRNPKLEYRSGYELEIEREKRLKFRRLPYKPINAKKLCSGEWRHIIGQGHRHVFQNATPKIENVKLSKVKAKKSDTKTVQMYPDAKYISMINNPSHKPCSWRSEPLPVRPMKFEFNCMRKLTKRKQLKENKKIAFLSGMLRFKDIDPPKLITPEMLAEKIESLPPNLRIHHDPVMTKKKKDIKSLLNKIPAHWETTSEKIQRRDLFKFSVLPQPKILISRQEIEGQEQPFYGKDIEEDYYYKNDAVIPPLDAM